MIFDHKIGTQTFKVNLDVDTYIWGHKPGDIIPYTLDCDAGGRILNYNAVIHGVQTFDGLVERLVAFRLGHLGLNMIEERFHDRPIRIAPLPRYRDWLSFPISLAEDENLIDEVVQAFSPWSSASCVKELKGGRMPRLSVSPPIAPLTIMR